MLLVEAPDASRSGGLDKIKRGVAPAEPKQPIDMM